MLHLQGIPTETLSLASESNPELMHLAGNAMTVTVVGCALAAGLLCGDILGSGARLAATAPFWRQPRRAARGSTTHQAEVRKDLLCELVAATSPRCLCAGAAKDPMQCDICYHTACTECGTHPLHSYPCIETDLSMEAFAALTHLPLTFGFSKVRHKCTGPCLTSAQFDVVTAPPPVFTPLSVRTVFARA